MWGGGNRPTHGQNWQLGRPRAASQFSRGKMGEGAGEGGGDLLKVLLGELAFENRNGHSLVHSCPCPAIQQIWQESLKAEYGLPWGSDKED